MKCLGARAQPPLSGSDRGPQTQEEPSRSPLKIPPRPVLSPPIRQASILRCHLSPPPAANSHPKFLDGSAAAQDGTESAANLSKLAVRDPQKTVLGATLASRSGDLVLGFAQDFLTRVRFEPTPFGLQLKHSALDHSAILPTLSIRRTPMRKFIAWSICQNVPGPNSKGPWSSEVGVVGQSLAGCQENDRRGSRREVEF